MVFFNSSIAKALGLFPMILLSLSLIGVPQTLAATMTFSGKVTFQRSDVLMYKLEGQIAQSDVDALNAMIASSQDESAPRMISMNSRGGSFETGLNLALFFRRNGFATLVEDGNECFSACAIAFLGGSEPVPELYEDHDAEYIPNQLPSRTIENGAKLGFHAPYLDFPKAQYNAEIVADAYSGAVQSISRLISIADHLYIRTAELPTLMQPTKDDLYMVDNPDAVGFLDIRYIDTKNRHVDGADLTKPAISNACINHYYHLSRTSSVAGFALAAQIKSEFIEGSKLLGNWEEELSFGRDDSTAFMPIAWTEDRKTFVWCIYDKSGVWPKISYRSAGTVSDLFSPDATTISPGDTETQSRRLEYIEMLPPTAKISEIHATMQSYVEETLRK